jgi:uncharacterized membrane protein
MGAAMIAGTPAMADDATYTPLPGYDVAATITRDGTVVGLFNPFATEGYLWTVDDGVIATIPIMDQFGGITDDGMMVGGTHYPLGGEPPKEFAGRWTAADGWENLGDLGMGFCDALYSHGYDISGDGSVVVGLGWEDCSGRAHKWTPEDGMVMLSQENYDRSARANTVSGDGTMIAGWEEMLSGPRRPCYWTADGTQTIPWAEGGGEFWDTNSDGSVMVGWLWNIHGYHEAIRYEPGGDADFLGILPGGFGDWTSQAFGMSESGNTIVGNSGSFWDGFFAWIWKPDLGMMPLKDYLISLGVEGLEDITFENAYAISADGSVIVGNTLEFPFTRNAYVVTIPAESSGDPCPADIDGNGMVDVTDLLVLLGNWGGEGDGDIDGNGVVDTQDLLALLAAWGPCA